MGLPIAWLTNLSVAFLLSALIVLALLRILRPRPMVLLFMALLPFARLGLDLAFGVPDDVHIWYALKGNFIKQVIFLLGHEGRPCSAPALYCLHSSPDAPSGHYPTRLVAGVKAAVDGEWHSLGVGDILARVLAEWVPALPLFVFATILTVSAAISVRHLISGWTFEKQRRALRRSEGTRTIGRVELWWRSVDVYSTHGHHGSPFTGGLFSPYVCFPSDTLGRLSAAEAQAALAHELTHVRRLDILIIGSIGLVRGLSWFVPLIGVLRAHVEHALELAADAASARANGAEAMASAILRVGESVASGPAPHLPSLPSLGVASPRSRLRQRIEALLERRSRLDTVAYSAQLAIAAAAAFVTLTSAFLGYR